MRTPAITRFIGRYRFLSNFYPATINFQGREFPTVEHAYQYAKTLDKEYRERIWDAATPSEAKHLGRRAPLRPDWDDLRVSCMRALVYAKFNSYTDYADRLLATGDAILVEGNDWGDDFWGAVLKGGEWVGLNWLGRILMEIRNQLREEKQDAAGCKIRE